MTNDDVDSPQNPGKVKKSASSEISDAVLKSLKPRAGKGTTKWLADIPQQALEEPSAGAAAEPAPLTPATDMVTMVDTLVDLFTTYTFEFTRSVGSRELNVEVERPTQRKAGDPRYGYRAGAAFCGRLAMRQWSLMIRGETEKIEGAIVPSDQILAYNADPSQFVAFFTIELFTGAVVPVWRLDRTVLQLEDLRTLAKQLLVSLMRFAKGELTQGDQFDWTANLETAPGCASSGNTPMPGAQMPDRPPSFYAESESSLFGPDPDWTPPKPELLTPQPPQPASDFGQSQQPPEVARKTLSVPFALGLLEEAVAKEMDKLS